MYEIAVCDDCAADRSRLIERIKANHIGDAQIRIHEYDMGRTLLDAMKEISFAMIFLDVQMKGMDGDETAVRIREFDTNVVLVFYTGFAEPSPRSFEVQPYRYIMKNMSVSQMNEYVDAALRQMVANSNKPLLQANINREQYIIKTEHIIYIEKFKKSTRVHIAAYAYKLYGMEKNEDGVYPDIRIADKLDHLYEKLKMHGFGYPHDSYVVNFAYMVSCTAKSLKLAEVDGMFQISRSKGKVFNEQKAHFMQSKYVGGRS